MTHIFGFFLALTIAACTGFGATWLAIERGNTFDRVKVGAWSTWSKAGSSDADPYTKAIFAKTGEVALHSAEGRSLISRGDDNGDVLNSACTYVILGSLPQSKLWTLTSYKPDGQLAPNNAERYSITSNDIVRYSNNDFEIIVSASVQSGNWLPIAKSEPFQLVFRLYGTTIGNTATEIQSVITISNQKRDCS